MLFTIGHSNRTLDQFIDILKAHSIDVLVDIRGGEAGSRAFPHFNTESLAKTLPVTYYRQAELGGRRPRCKTADDKLNSEWRLPAFKNYADYAYYSDQFSNGVKKLVKDSKNHRLAYMCSEAVPWRCHRSIVTDYICLVHKLPVTHILSATQTLEGRPNTFAKAKQSKVIYPSNDLLSRCSGSL